MSVGAELSSASPLRATVGVASLLPLPPGVQQPLLQGQTQASALPNGTISISDLSLVAVPGDYNVSITLPDFDQVSRVHKLECLLAKTAAIWDVNTTASLLL